MRVSTEEQSLGPEAQRAAIEAWAAREGVTIMAVHEDRLSGATDVPDRPGLLSALSDLGRLSAGVLVVAKRDRIARDVVIAAMVERAAASSGARVVSADGTGNGDTPADAFMRTILDGAAAYERALIRSRTKAALAAKSARGERVGAVPYGYRLASDGTRLVPDAAEQETIALVRRLASEGMSQNKIARELASSGIVGRSGRPLFQAQIGRMLARPALDSAAE